MSFVFKTFSFHRLASIAVKNVQYGISFNGDALFLIQFPFFHGIIFKLCLFTSVVLSLLKRWVCMSVIVKGRKGNHEDLNNMLTCTRCVRESLCHFIWGLCRLIWSLCRFIWTFTLCGIKCITD